LVKEGEELYKQKAFGDAKKKFDAAKVLDPTNSDAWDWLQKLMDYIAKAIAQGIADFKKGQALEEKKDGQEGSEDFAKATKKFEASAKEYEKAVEADPQNTDAQKGLKKAQEKAKMTQLLAEGVELFKQGKFEEALEKFNQAMKEHPDDKKVKEWVEKTEYMLKSVVMEVQGDPATFKPDNFKVVFATALGVSAANVRIFVMGSSMQRRLLTRKQQALKLYVSVEDYEHNLLEVVSSPNFKNAMASSGYPVLAVFDPEKFKLSQAPTSAPSKTTPAPPSSQQQAEALVTKGIKHYALGEYQEAQTKFEAAAKLDPNNEEAAQWLRKTIAKRVAPMFITQGVALYRNGLYAQAKEKFLAAQRADPLNSDAALWLNKCNTRLAEHQPKVTTATAAPTPPPTAPPKGQPAPTIHPEVERRLRRLEEEVFKKKDTKEVPAKPRPLPKVGGLQDSVSRSLYDPPAPDTSSHINGGTMTINAARHSGFVPWKGEGILGKGEALDKTGKTGDEGHTEKQLVEKLQEEILLNAGGRVLQELELTGMDRVIPLADEAKAVNGVMPEVPSLSGGH
jgi:tetratricopeptide (TPR) repeat protein